MISVIVDELARGANAIPVSCPVPPSVFEGCTPTDASGPTEVIANVVRLRVRPLAANSSVPVSSAATAFENVPPVANGEPATAVPGYSPGVKRGYVFLSYAAERRALAERISLALRAEGFGVFFDRTDLPPGTGFDARIRTALGRSGLFIFLLSPESIDKGSYALSELAFAREKWPTPGGRVLLVLVEPVPIESVPSYLRAVTILVPSGENPDER